MTDSVPSTSSSDSDVTPPARPTGIHRYRRTGTTDVIVYYPTAEEFKDFNGCIKRLEEAGAHLSCGIAKIVPPEGYNPRPGRQPGDYSDVDNLKIDNPIQQTIIRGVAPEVYYVHSEIYKKSITVKDYRQMAMSKQYANPKPDSGVTDIEKDYFKSMMATKPIYGADTEGSIYDPDVKEFNVSKLGTILDETAGTIKGVNSTMLYFGMYKATFAWHSEDMDLYSINYLHHGAPKYWFAIPSIAATQFEKFTKSFSVDSCKAYLRHKTMMITPTLLRNYNIPFGTIIHHPNEFIITFPKGYHMGFNLGYNIAESTNFASDRWIDYGKNATVCNCRSDSVEIDMRPFMLKYRPEEYESWHRYWYIERATKTPIKGRRRKNESQDESSAKKRSRVSPAVLQEEKEYSPLQPSTFSQPKWAAEMKKRDLWSDKPRFDCQKEYEFNAEEALIFPHCAICSAFCPKFLRRRLSAVPERSRRYLPTRMLSKDDATSTDGDSMEDMLVRCTTCSVVVHPACYSANRKLPKLWKCQRCITTIGSPSVNSCFMCPLRGGALILCRRFRENGLHDNFIHVLCGLFNKRTTFEPIAEPKLAICTPAYRELTSSAKKTSVTTSIDDSHHQCEVCQMNSEALICCEKCPDDVLQAAFVHATCAAHSGFHFEERSNPPYGIVMCAHHNWEDEDPPTSRPVTPSITPSSNPLVMFNGAPTPCHIVAKHDGFSVVAQFLDGSETWDLPPGDVAECSCAPNCDAKSGRHFFGSKLVIRWSEDGVNSQPYHAYYRKVQVRRDAEFTVRVGSALLRVGREQIISDVNLISKPM